MTAASIKLNILGKYLSKSYRKFDKFIKKSRIDKVTKRFL